MPCDAVDDGGEILDDGLDLILVGGLIINTSEANAENLPSQTRSDGKIMIIIMGVWAIIDDAPRGGNHS